MTSNHATIEHVAVAPLVDSFTRTQLHARRGAAASAEAATALSLIDERLMSTLRRIAGVERETARRAERARLEQLIARTYSCA
ncbi:MAG: hypothetical protein H7287_02635 [Thermoleophilia bacterium]|nr:hypothetical protein [Thermoleophilia bacterium]